jgi:hypothetical protein
MRPLIRPPIKKPTTTFLKKVKVWSQTRNGIHPPSITEDGKSSTTVRSMKKLDLDSC